MSDDKNLQEENQEDKLHTEESVNPENTQATDEQPKSEADSPADSVDTPQEEMEETSAEEPVSEDESTSGESLEENPVEEETKTEAEAPQEVTEVSEEIEQEPEEVVQEIPVEAKEEAAPEPQPEVEEKEGTPSDEGIVGEEPVAEQSKETEAESSQEEVDESSEVSEETEQEPEEEEELPDYSTFTREQLVVVAEELTHQDNFNRSAKIIELIEPLFKVFEDEIRSEALKKYVDDGGEEDSFEFRHDELFNRFDASVRLVKDRRTAFYKEKEANKVRNLEKKQELLEKLRELVDGEDASTSIKPIKEIQETWKAIGPVPGQHNKTLWANYNALLDRFYHNRHILFELRDLDRKKNYTAKLELCEKAEALDRIESVKEAVIQLNELHEEYKRIGAVPRNVQEELWQRFKAASDKVYKRRKEYVDHLKTDLKDNLEKKRVLITELQPFTEFQSDRINDWNAKSKEILDVQKRWEAIGGVPRENAKEINRDFWSAFKKFFANKNEFFRKLEGLRKENLQKKEELVQQAIALQESQDWDKTSEQLKQLQRQWKEIGPVPEKKRNEVYARFKEACDAFFNNRRSHLNEAESQYVENQKAKEAILAELEKVTKTKKGSEEELMAKITEYNEKGFVPRNAIKTLETKFKEVVSVYVQTLGLEDSEAESLLMKAELTGGPKGGGADRRVQKKESTIRRQINELEDNIALWNNNLAFFANSKTADKLRVEFDEKIAAAQADLDKLKKQLRVLRSI